MSPPTLCWCRNLRFAQLLLLSSLPLFFYPVRSGLVNVTVDDQLGDPTTGLFPDYSPNDGTWHFGSPSENCPTCTINPSTLDLTQVYDQTWHDATYRPPDTPATITVCFDGSAVYVFNILPNTLPHTNTFANISFSIDGEDVGLFTRSPEPGTTILYNQLVYHNTTLNTAPHTLVMTAANSSLVLFDYLVYTTESHDTTSTSPPNDTTSTNTPDGSSQGSPSSPRHTRRRTPIGAIVGAILGGIALLGVAVAAFFLHRRHISSRATQKRVHGTEHDRDANGNGSERERRLIGGDRRAYVSPPHAPFPTTPTSLPEPTMRSLDGAMAHNFPQPDPASNVSRPDSTLAHPSLSAIPDTVPAEWPSKRRAELARRLEILQRTRAALSSQPASTHSRSEVSTSGGGTETAIRELEAEMSQFRGVLTALNVRLAEGHGGYPEPLPAYGE